MPGRRPWLYCLLLVLLLTMSAGLLTGCGKKKQTAKKPNPTKVKIAICLADMQRDGNKTIARTIKKEAQTAGVDLLLAEAGGDAFKQVSQLQELGQKKVKAVIWQPVNAALGQQVLPQLARDKIKVVVLDSLPREAAVDGYVAANHALTGQLLARYALERQARRVVLLGGDPQDRAVAAMVESVQRELAAAGVQPLAVLEHPVEKTPAVSGELARLDAGGGFDAVLATDSKLAVEAVKYLQGQNRTARVTTVGVGADEAASQALAAGLHDAEIDTRPDLLARYALNAARELAEKGQWSYEGQLTEGTSAVPYRYTPVRLIDQQNIYLLAERWQSLTKGGQKGGQGQSGSAGQSGGGQGGGSSGSSGGQGSTSPGGQGGGEQKKTVLRITTMEGQTMEVEVPGEIKKIETQGAGGRQGGGQKSTGRSGSGQEE
ncbi:sugar ABC transporter substrate-binding protein [Desulfurispora thermophila]|uniref:sugar ABC transporter substrate-binding protein n=1 Tax=Desulfurispora thermophila TaxID=265470 RepID=UPI000366F32F|nr:substrate-binding domain-containing protein [Desulfurispora thermophila]